MSRSVCVYVYLAQQDFRANDLYRHIESERKKSVHKTVSNAASSRKWLKRNRKMMMKIFFLNSFFSPFQYTHGVLGFFLLLNAPKSH